MDTSGDAGQLMKERGDEKPTLPPMYAQQGKPALEDTLHFDIVKTV